MEQKYQTTLSTKYTLKEGTLFIDGNVSNCQKLPPTLIPNSITQNLEVAQMPCNKRCPFFGLYNKKYEDGTTESVIGLKCMEKPMLLNYTEETGKPKFTL